MNNLSPMSSRMQIVEGKTPIISGVFQRWLNNIYSIVSSILSDIYTPEFTNILNTSAYTDIRFKYTAIGNNVNVFGEVRARVQSFPDFEFKITAPIDFDHSTVVCVGYGNTETNGNICTIQYNSAQSSITCKYIGSALVGFYYIRINFSYNIK